MGQRFSDEELRSIRNDILISVLIQEILMIPSKEEAGIFRFLCPQCQEFQTAVNTKTNLSRCFRCQKNFNNIDLVMLDRKVNFVDSIKYLKQHLSRPAEHPPGCSRRPGLATSNANIS